MVQQVYASELQVGDIFSKTGRKITAISVKPHRITIEMGDDYATLCPSDVFEIMARNIPASQNG